MDLHGVGFVPLAELFALLLLGIGPVRIAIAFLPFAQALAPDTQRALAWRTVVAGFIVAVAIMMVGAGIVATYGLNVALLQLAAGIAFFVITVPGLVAAPGDRAPSPPGDNVLRLAISPLAVPTMITPLGIAVLFAVAAFAPGIADRLIVVGLVAVILAANFGTMLIARHIARFVTRPVLDVLQKVLGLVVLGYSLRLVLQSLGALGVIAMPVL